MLMMVVVAGLLIAGLVIMGDLDAGPNTGKFNAYNTIISMIWHTVDRRRQISSRGLALFVGE